MKSLLTALVFFCLPAWGHFCPEIVLFLSEPDVEFVTQTPAFADTLEELEIPHVTVQLGHALGAAAVRKGIDLVSNRPLVAFLKQVLDGGLRQAARANALDPWTTITIRLHLEPYRLLITFQDQAAARNNPWDSARRRAITGQGTPVPLIWETLARLDLSYYFAFENRGNVFTIAIPWDLAL